MLPARHFCQRSMGQPSRSVRTWRPSPPVTHTTPPLDPVEPLRHPPVRSLSVQTQTSGVQDFASTAAIPHAHPVRGGHRPRISPPARPTCRTHRRQPSMVCLQSTWDDSSIPLRRMAQALRPFLPSRLRPATCVQDSTMPPAGSRGRHAIVIQRQNRTVSSLADGPGWQLGKSAIAAS